MKERVLQYVVCPECKGDLSIMSDARYTGDEITEGHLACGACGRHYPIIRGIPRLLPSSIAATVRSGERVKPRAASVPTTADAAMNPAT